MTPGQVLTGLLGSTSWNLGRWEHMSAGDREVMEGIAREVTRTAWRLLEETRADLAILTEQARGAGVISEEEAAGYRLRARAET